MIVMFVLYKCSPKALIFYPILSAYFLSNCMEITLNNLYVDIGT